MRALIVVDVQNDFIRGGALAVPHSERVPIEINRLVMERPEDYPLIVLTQDWHPNDHNSFARTWKVPEFSIRELPYGPQVMWPVHCVQESFGAQISTYLALPTARLIIRKGCDPRYDSYSAFEDAGGRGTGLAQYLNAHSVNEVDVVGLALDYCVAATAVHARARGYQTRVLKHCCASIDRDHSLAKAVADMHRAGVKIE